MLRLAFSTGPLCVITLCFVSGCRREPTGLPDLSQISLSLVSGDAQSGLAGAELPQPLVIKAKDARGQGIRELTVNFRVTSGGGSMFAGVATTDNQGMAADYWTLGTVAGQAQRVEVRAVLANGQKQVYGVFTATALPAPATQIALNAGDNQTAPVNTAVAIPPSVIVRDQFNNPVGGVAVTFVVTTGGGSVTGGSATTSAAGIAAAGSWTLGADPGPYALTATATGSGIQGNPVTFAATATPVPVVIALSPASVALTGAYRGVPRTQAIQVTSATGVPITGLTVTVLFNEQTAWLDAQLSSTGTPSTLTLTATPGGLSPGDHFAQVSVSSPQGIAQPLVVKLSVFVLPDLTFTGTHQVGVNGNTVTVTGLEVFNQGYLDAAPFSVGACLSTTSALSDCLAEIGAQVSSPRPGLVASGVDQIPPLQLVVGAAGVYHVLTFVNPPFSPDHIVESDESNNFLDLGTVETQTTAVFPLTVAVTGAGTVTGPSISCPLMCDAAYQSGTIVTLSVSASDGNVFWKWSRDCSGASCSLTMDGPRSVLAQFVAGTSLCDGNPQPKHANGLGDFYYDCNPLGQPGIAATYNVDMARAAATAWNAPGKVLSSGLCSGDPVIIGTSTNGVMAIWSYSGATAGYVSAVGGGGSAPCPSNGGFTVSPWN